MLVGNNGERARASYVPLLALPPTQVLQYFRTEFKSNSVTAAFVSHDVQNCGVCVQRQSAIVRSAWKRVETFKAVTERFAIRYANAFWNVVWLE